MSPSRRLRIFSIPLMACLVLLSPGAVLGQATFDEIGEALIVTPRPTTELFVDPIRDVLHPSLANVNPRAAEIEPWRLDVRPAHAELSPARADLRIAELEPSASLFLDPARRENELVDVETVGRSGGLVLIDRVTRRPDYAEQVALRRSRFGRSETPRQPPLLDPARPLGPRTAELAAAGPVGPTR